MLAICLKKKIYTRVHIYTSDIHRKSLDIYKKFEWYLEKEE